MLTAIAWAAQQGLPAVVVRDADGRFGRSIMLWSSAATPHEVGVYVSAWQGLPAVDLPDADAPGARVRHGSAALAAHQAPARRAHHGCATDMCSASVDDIASKSR